MVGKGRHNYHEEAEASINKQINIELNAHYQYLALVIDCKLYPYVENQVE